MALAALSLLTSCCRRRATPSEDPTGIPPGAVPVEANEPGQQGARGAPAASTSAPPPGTVPVLGAVVLPNGMTAPMSFSPLVKACDPAVVTIFAFIDERGRSGRRRRVGQGLGSGFFYESSGYILTNNHVVADATELVVRMADERRLVAKLIGRDAPTDVAVIKVDVTGAPFLPLADSNLTEIGDWVVAIGNPFGLSHTVSAGIVSAKGRNRDDVGDLDKTGRGYFNFLQTDASINPGNSGGPLINLKGEVVGINAAIRANANTIGFAIPINMVKSLVPMLVRDGKVKRSALGVQVVGVGEEEVARLKRPNRKGALVRVVVPGGPSDTAGIAADDVIVAFNGTPVNDPEELRWLASIAGVGNQATVRVSRGERTFDVKVPLGALPDESEEAPAVPVPVAPGFP